jgi:hypothetical protein
MLSKKHGTLLLIAFTPFLLVILGGLVILIKTSRNPVNDILGTALFAVAVVVVNVAGIRVSLSRKPGNSAQKNNS